MSQTFGFNFDLIFTLSSNISSPRTELLININNQRRGSERPGSPFDVRLTAGLRIGNWKLLTGNGGVGKNELSFSPVFGVEAFSLSLYSNQLCLKQTHSISYYITEKMLAAEPSSLYKGLPTCCTAQIYLFWYYYILIHTNEQG